MSGTDPDLRDQLKSFGFSDKEIDTYTTILTLGEAKASAIAEGADVSKRYVYNVLGEFEDRGLVEIHDHETPTTVRALDPSTVVDRLSDTLSTLEGNLDALYEPDPEVDRRYEVIKSTATVRKRISRLLREAENEVSLSVHASIVSDLAADLRSAVDRGVLTLVLVNDDGTDAVERDRFDGLRGARLGPHRADDPQRRPNPRPVLSARGGRRAPYRPAGHRLHRGQALAGAGRILSRKLLAPRDGGLRRRAERASGDVR